MKGFAMIKDASQLINDIKENIRTTFAGNGTTVDRVICCLLSGGHLLLEDVPGVGNTDVFLLIMNN